MSMNPLNAICTGSLRLALMHLEGSVGEEHELRSHVELPTNCVALVKLLNLAGPHVIHLKIRNQGQWLSVKIP